MPPLPAPVVTFCGDATMPGHGVAHRSGNVFSATALNIPSIPSPFFLDEPMWERWGEKDRQGMDLPSRLGLPQWSTARLHPNKAPTGVASCGPQTNLDLGPSWWLLGVLPHLPWQSRKGSGVWQQPKSILVGLVPCNPSPHSASSSLSSRFTSSPVLPGKAHVVLNL